MAKSETLQRKADDLLKRGDAAGYRSAEGCRLLRKCRYYRRLTKKAENASLLRKT